MHRITKFEVYICLSVSLSYCSSILSDSVVAVSSCCSNSSDSVYSSHKPRQCVEEIFIGVGCYSRPAFSILSRPFRLFTAPLGVARRDNGTHIGNNARCSIHLNSAAWRITDRLAQPRRYFSAGAQYVRTTTGSKMYQFQLNLDGYRYLQVSI